MKRTIELPERLTTLLEEYLKENSFERLCSFLEAEIALNNPEFKDFSEFLKLAGSVKDLSADKLEFWEPDMTR